MRNMDVPCWKLLLLATVLSGVLFLTGSDPVYAMDVSGPGITPDAAWDTRPPPSRPSYPY